MCLTLKTAGDTFSPNQRVLNVDSLGVFSGRTRETITAYKVYRVVKKERKTEYSHPDCLHFAFQMGHLEGPGLLKSSRKNGTKLKRNESQDGSVECGFHVFLDKTTATKWARTTNRERPSAWRHVVVEVACKLEHFVASGNWDGDDRACAVFTRIHLSQKEWDKALSRR